MYIFCDICTKPLPQGDESIYYKGGSYCVTHHPNTTGSSAHLNEVYFSRPSGKRFECIFVNDKNMHTSDCAFDDFDAAVNYVRWISSTLDFISSGRVFDRMNKEVLFIFENSK